LILQCQLFISTPPKASYRSHCLMHFRISHFCQAAHMHNPIANLLSYPTTFPHFPTPTLVPLPLRAHAQEPLQGQNTCGSRQPLSSLCTVCNKEAKSMKNRLSRSHSSNQGMLSSALIHSCDLSCMLDPWHLVSHAKVFLESRGIRHL